jgi:nitroreductase/dihydropteridine reductase
VGFLSQLEWRYAAKGFDKARSVSEHEIKEILNAIRLAPSSFGLQPYFVLQASSSQREALRAVSWNQPQVTDAAHYLIFCVTNKFEERIQTFLEAQSSIQNKPLETLQGYGNIIRGFINAMTQPQQLAWAQRQAYLALGFGLAACAELSIDSCAMEGIDTSAYNRILGLPEHESSVVALAMGYRPDNTKVSKKFRFKDVIR